MKLIGIEKRAGVYNDKPYCNYLFYVQVEREGRGVLVDTLKIKEKAAETIKDQFKKDSVYDLVGLTFQYPYYDSFRNVVGLM